MHTVIQGIRINRAASGYLPECFLSVHMPYFEMYIDLPKILGWHVACVCVKCSIVQVRDDECCGICLREVYEVSGPCPHAASPLPSSFIFRRVHSTHTVLYGTALLQFGTYNSYCGRHRVLMFAGSESATVHSAQELAFVSGVYEPEVQQK